MDQANTLTLMMDYNNNMEVVQAAGRGDVERLTFLLQKGDNRVNCRWDGHTPLAVAALNNHADCVSLLLECGADVDSTDESGITPLGHVARLGHVTCILPLIRASARKDFKRRFESSQQQWQARFVNEMKQRRFDVVEAMLINFNDDQSPQEDLLNLIMFLLLSHNCPLHTLNLVIDLGAHVNANFRYGITPLIFTSAAGMADQLDVLLQKGADENLYDDLCHMTPVLYAAKNGDIFCLKLLIKNGPRTSDVDSQCRDALMHAAESGSEECVSLLLRNGYCVNNVSSSGMSPLMYAACSNNINCVEFLLSKGCKVTEVDKEGKSSLIYAAEKGMIGCLAFLLSKGCTADEQDTWEKSALMYAVEHGQLQCVDFLLKSGADVHHIDASGKNAIHFAADTGKVECLDKILKYGCDVNVKDGMGVSALMLASLCGSVKSVELLLNYGAEANVADSMAGRTSVMYAARKGSAQCMHLLLEAGARCKVADNLCRTVLMYAAEGGNVDCLDLVLGLDWGETVSQTKMDISDNVFRADTNHMGKNTIDNVTLDHYVNSVDFRGMTALILATRQGEAKVVKRLLEAGADVAKVSSSGETALSTAIHIDNTEIVELILNADYYNHDDAPNRESPDCMKMAVRTSSQTILDKLVQKRMFQWDWFDNADIDFVRSIYPLLIDAGIPPGVFKTNGHCVTLLGFSLLNQDFDMAQHLLNSVYLSYKDLASHLQDANFQSAPILLQSVHEEARARNETIKWPLTLQMLSLVAVSECLQSHGHQTHRNSQIETLPLPPMLKRKLQYRSGSLRVVL